MFCGRWLVFGLCECELRESACVCIGKLIYVIVGIFMIPESAFE